MLSEIPAGVVEAKPKVLSSKIVVVVPIATLVCFSLFLLLALIFKILALWRIRKTFHDEGEEASTEEKPGEASP